MDRRFALMALATAAASPLLSQAGFAADADAQALADADHTIAPSQADAASLNQPISREEWRTRTAQLGTVAKHSSAIAYQRSTTAAVRRFAQLEVIEQTAIATALTNQQNPPPAPLTDAQQQDIAALQSIQLPGLDAAYVKLQFAGHLSLRALQLRFLAGAQNLADADVHTALLAKSNIQQHLLLLLDLGRTSQL